VSLDLALLDARVTDPDQRLCGGYTMTTTYLLALITTRRWRHELENHPDLYAQLPHQPH
jgi:hypothetical protein